MAEETKKPEHNYYFFKADSFFEKKFASDEDAATHGRETEGVLKVEAARHSKIIFEKSETK